MKIKVTIIETKIYEVNPDYYPKGSTPEDIVKLDKKQLEEDPCGFFDDVDSSDIKLEIMEY